MPFLTLHSLPEIRFAHRFCDDLYHGHIPQRKNRIEISVITEGGFRVTRGQSTHTAVAGDITCNFYGSPMMVDTDAYHAHHTVCFSVEYDVAPGRALPPLVLRGAEGREACRRLIDEIIRSFALHPSHTWKTAGLFLQLLDELDRCCDAQRDEGTPGEHRYVVQAKRYALEHISQPVRQSEIAAHLGITSEYLCNVFKKSEHISIMRFINETKLTGIRLMMESKGIPLHQAAAQYGFSDANYVSRLYKKYYGRPITEAVRRG
ncbi:MAG: helix-turn-helix transcriptional regulator [Ruminococcaceae bacterium]|nr:helix-turn-helix transcriptional regulator [Oscillospiraceae bacterium]